MSESTKTVLPDVRPGQVWADNDPRIPLSDQRFLLVEDVTDLGGGPRARVRRVVQLDTGQWAPHPRSATTSIAVRRFRPNSTGYRLVQDEARWT
ncbi:hypothetical protein [Cellulomonas sp.]|uniref:hypothetical protein n=1 Tax=Cellulomonas sp. TaxID=40001 RepID=UPI001B0AAC0C|nr:hypothetical protein [Cellulomonas sp.]MBO9555559.1 hypothetical protein [Cellulomonas sp.]